MASMNFTPGEEPLEWFREDIQVPSHTKALLETNPAQAIAYLIIMGTVVCLGCFGNASIIATCILDKTLRCMAGTEYLVNLAISDLCVACVANPMCIVGK